MQEDIRGNSVQGCEGGNELGISGGGVDCGLTGVESVF